MAFIQVNALVGTQEMSIELDDNDWVSLEIDGNKVPKKQSGRWFKTIKLTQGKKVPFKAIADSLEILNPGISYGINGVNYDAYWLVIDFDYINGKTQVALTGSIEYKGGLIHGAPNEYEFSQGHLNGVFCKIEP